MTLTKSAQQIAPTAIPLSGDSNLAGSPFKDRKYEGLTNGSKL
jgi:hypothetical protein